MRTKKLFIFFLGALILFWSTCFTCSAIDQQQLVVNTGFTPPVSTIFRLVLNEAGQRLGIHIHFQEMPAERSLLLVSAGIDDAECCRIPGAIRQDYPDLLGVPVSFFTARFSAFTRDKTIEIHNWNDLKPYHVGTVSGWKILVNNIAKVQPEGYVILDTAEAMFNMLDRGRIEIATLGYYSGLEVMHELNLRNIQVLEPPLAAEPLYMQFHQSHADLVPKFAKVFEEMKADGTIDRINSMVLALYK